MPSKLFCVATQHDLRKIMPRSSIKKFLRHFFQKVAYPNLCNFLKKWQNPISVTFSSGVNSSQYFFLTYFSRGVVNKL